MEPAAGERARNGPSPSPVFVGLLAARGPSAQGGICLPSRPFLVFLHPVGPVEEIPHHARPTPFDLVHDDLDAGPEITKLGIEGKAIGGVPAEGGRVNAGDCRK